MSKFKVGDKVRIVANRGCSVNDIGDVGVVTDLVELDVYEYRVKVGDRTKLHNWSYEDDLELVTENTLQVGQTYTSENGCEWECIFVRDSKAWMIGIYTDGAYGNAYDFDIDGTASWAGGSGAEGYNIKWGPKRETKRHVIYANGEKRDTEFDVVDGAVDWDSLRVLPCD